MGCREEAGAHGIIAWSLRRRWALTAMREHARLKLSISTTTRSMRPGEEDGVHYNFVSESKFREAVARGQFLEWAEVHGHFYGSDGRWVDEQLSEEA